MLCAIQGAAPSLPFAIAVDCQKADNAWVSMPELTGFRCGYACMSRLESVMGSFGESAIQIPTGIREGTRDPACRHSSKLVSPAPCCRPSATGS